MIQDENFNLEVILENNGFSKLEKSLVQELNKVVREGTLGYKVKTAITQKKQGHFDKAMLNISEVNRDQVLSIRQIQSILDDINGGSRTEIILEKYRQIFPLQIGLTNGEDVLELLSLIENECDFDLEENVTDLHRNEEMVDPIIEELHFYEIKMKGQIPENEINELKGNLELFKTRIFEIKISLLSCICRVIQREYNRASILNRIMLIKNIYIVISSSIQTLDAKLVEVE